MSWVDFIVVLPIWVVCLFSYYTDSVILKYFFIVIGALHLIFRVIYCIKNRVLESAL